MNTTNKPETLCSGCGATVNFQMGHWRDSAGQSACSGRKVGMLCSHYVKDQSLLDYPAIPDYIQDPIVFRDVVLGTALVGTLHDEQWVCRVVNGSWVTVRRTNSADPLFIEALNKKSVTLPPVAIAPEPQRTPQKYELDNATDNGVRYFIIHGQLPTGLNADYGYPICDSMNRHHCISPEEDDANGEKILRALNSHDDMLAALKELVRMVGGTLQGYGVLEAPMNAAKTAISKAEDFMEEARRTR